MNQKVNSLKIIKKLFLLIYILMIIEGVFRKWFLPAYSSILFFLKDPIVIAVYFYAIRAGLFYRGKIFYAYIFVAILIVIQAIFFCFIYPENLIIYGYGIRNYLLYIPLIFVAVKCLDKDDINKIAKWTLISAIPVSVLVYIQVSSPATAYINKGIAEEGFVFQVARGVVRPYGLFSFAMGHVLYVASLFIFSLALFFKCIDIGSAKLSKRALNLVALISICFLFFTTGTRSIYAYSVFTMLGFMFCMLFAPKKSLLVQCSVLFVAFLLLLFGFTFTESYELIVERNMTAVDVEGSIIYRVFKSLFAFASYIDSAPIFGYGVGSGTNAASVLTRGISELGMGFLLAEDEWSRIVLELGYPLGIIYILFRLYLMVWMFFISIQAFRKGNFLPILLFGLAGAIVLNGVMTMQGTVLAYGALFSSFLIGAAIRPKRTTPEKLII